ncbi:flagellar P-ring protein [Tepiditoga spiralis]|uniref:Flagellar P-ring protein n=1 Tax=Tepiditoga spiralis TaxID=2108365 RepID=A0A7G1G1B7_9BACT|nr:flagellar basal body P-ring protein FlgI [Tepiditoga spiralis]BBE29940.1 flagellar P-ring protein [Tepiditoga spiralis]
MKKIILVLILIVSILSFANVRIKDISDFRGARDNQLFGIGIVTGLNGTGDSGNIPSEMLNNLFKNLGMQIKNQITSKNTAVVIITADIPSFYKEGMKLDVTVSAVGDSKSIENGVLIQTPLYGADNNVYAVAQGNVLTGGAEVKSTNLQKKYKVSGYIPQGAIVEKEIPANIVSNNTITLNLKHPDFSTAARVSMAINVTFSDKISKAMDSSSIKIKIPDVFYDDVVSFLALIEEIEVQPDVKAQIIINEKTGTIVLGGKVKLADFSLSYGNFVISVNDGSINGNPATIDNVIAALKASGATPQDIIAIIQNLSKAGYIYGEVVVM